MGLKSNYLTLAAMSMMAGMGTPSLYGYKPVKKSSPKCDGKKCKSCKLLRMSSYKGTCHKGIRDPWASACEDYAPKRKK